MDRCAKGGGGGGAPDAAMLRRAATEVALEEGARADLLAGYAAHRLAGRPALEWRRAAQGLRVMVPEWRRIVVSAIGSHADLSGLSSSDFALLSDVMGTRRGR